MSIGASGPWLALRQALQLVFKKVSPSGRELFRALLDSSVTVDSCGSFHLSGLSCSSPEHSQASVLSLLLFFHLLFLDLILFFSF